MPRKDPNDPRDLTATELLRGRQMDDARKDLNDRGTDLKQVLRDTYGLVNQLLIALNAGGAVACLAFLGSAGLNNVSHLIFYALSVFAIGTLLMAAMLILFLVDVLSVNKGWENNLAEFLRDELGIGTLWKEDAARGVSWPIHVGVWGGLTCFTIGVSLGIIGLVETIK